jgi:hypothetical protein
MRSLVSAAAIALLSGCSAVSVGGYRSDDPGPMPENYQSIVKSYLRENLRDPDSIKDLTISAPHQVRTWTGLMGEGAVSAWASCVGYNAKNAFGGYTGLKNHTYYIKGGALMSELDGTPRIRVGC